MSAKRPERKESGEWGRHLSYFLKRMFWRNKRRATKQELKRYVQETQDQ